MYIHENFYLNLFNNLGVPFALRSITPLNIMIRHKALQKITGELKISHYLRSLRYISMIYSLDALRILQMVTISSFTVFNGYNIMVLQQTVIKCQIMPLNSRRNELSSMIRKFSLRIVFLQENSANSEYWKGKL